jgi:phosphoribosylformylglycinamidine synthase
VRRRAGYGRRGLSCATSETGSRGGVGIEIDVAKVPQRETGMTPYEIMLSESQERMLLIVKRGREAEVERIFEKWDLHAVRIGEVTAGQLLRIKDHGTVVAEVPNRALTDEGPVYRRPFSRPAWLDDEQALPAEAAQTLARPTDTFLALLGSPTVASKQWIYRHTTTRCDEHDRARGRECRRRAREGHAARARDVGRRQRRYCQPRSAAGAALAVAEAARNVACAGGLPIGATNCLNFGNPSGRDHVAVRGSRRRIGDAAARSTCRSRAATSASTTRRTGARFCRRPSSASSA